VILDEPGCGYVLNKDLFLRDLSSRAAQAGVEIWLGSEAGSAEITDDGGMRLTVSGPDGQRAVCARSLVAADGIESKLARRAGIQPSLEATEVFSCAQYTVKHIDVDPHMVEFHFGRKVAPGGYAWVFPKGDSTANVGVGLICDDHKTRRPADCLEQFKQERCPRSDTIGHVVGGVPSVRDPFGACGRGIFAAGDAAGIADPVSGAGIVPGMESGAVAGGCASACARGDLDKGEAAQRFKDGLKDLYKDRRMRFAVRKVVSAMDDKELSKLVAATGEFAAGGSLIKADPFNVVKFLIKVMPSTFGIIKHLVRS
jgi:digeranylgeranylglycerophospholipid reductase